MAGNPYDIPLDDLELAVRTRAILEAAGCSSLANILLKGRRRINEQRGCGPAVLANIEHAVAVYGYRF